MNSSVLSMPTQSKSSVTTATVGPLSKSSVIRTANSRSSASTYMTKHQKGILTFRFAYATEVLKAGARLEKQLLAALTHAGQLPGVLNRATDILIYRLLEIYKNLAMARLTNPEQRLDLEAFLMTVITNWEREASATSVSADEPSRAEHRPRPTQSTKFADAPHHARFGADRPRLTQSRRSAPYPSTDRRKYLKGLELLKEHGNLLGVGPGVALSRNSSDTKDWLPRSSNTNDSSGTRNSSPRHLTPITPSITRDSLPRRSDPLYKEGVIMALNKAKKPARGQRFLQPPIPETA